MTEYTYAEHGFKVIHGLYSDRDLWGFEEAVKCLAGRQPVLAALSVLEQNHPEKFYQICSNVGGTIGGLSLFTDNLVEELVQIFGHNVLTITPSLPILFWNARLTTRLHYDWHQEYSYFHGQPKGCHLWFPIFNDVTPEDGPMRIAIGSHKESYPYSHEKVTQGLTQLRPCIDVEKTFSIYEACIPRGSAILFDHKTIHCTGVNKTDRPRVSGIIRFVDTLASPGGFTPMLGFVFKDRIAQAVEEGGA